MRAKLINEKFTEKSDPIADMGIGGVTLNDITKNVREEYEQTKLKVIRLEEDYKRELKNALESFMGKKITAYMGKIKEWNRVIDKEYTIRVHGTVKKEYENIFISVKGTRYIIYPDSKIVVHNES